MAISSFYGLQTSLRGLIAQQRLLDTTGHNIANASTEGYSRQQVTLAASAALQVQTSGTAHSVGGHLGSGVDVTGYRRVRDQFADLQYRGQNTGLAQQKARAEGLDSAELALNEPGDSGVSAQLGKFWTAWTNLSKNPADPSAKQALVGQAQSLTDSIQSVRSQLVSAQGAAQDQYDSITGTRGDIAQAATELAGLNKSIASFLVNGDAPNDLMDRRDMLLDQLSGYGQISVEKLDSGSVNVSFVDSTTGTKYPIVADQTASWSGPPAGDWSPGGQLGGLLSIAKSPGGSVDGYLGQLDTFATNLATTVNSAYGGSFFPVGSPAAGTIQVDPALVSDPTLVTAGTTGGGSNDIAMKILALRGSPSVDGSYKAFVTKV